MKDSRSWYHMSTRTTGGTYLKKLLAVRSKTVPGIGKKKKEWQLQGVLCHTQTQ